MADKPVIPTGPNLEYARGDMAPFQLVFTQAGAQMNWNGWSALKITVNSDNEPADTANQQIQFDGTPRAIDGSDGTVDYVPPNQGASDALVPGVYFYDATGLDPSSAKATLLLGGQFTIKQDINKD